MPKFSPSFYPELGDNCHQQAAAMFPVMCVTDLKNKILISNFPTTESKWVITKGRVNITTYWDSSTAYFQCTLPALDITEDIPQPPGNLFRHGVVLDKFQYIKDDDSLIQDLLNVQNIQGSGNKIVEELGDYETFSFNDLKSKITQVLQGISEDSAEKISESVDIRINNYAVDRTKAVSERTYSINPDSNGSMTDAEKNINRDDINNKIQEVIDTYISELEYFKNQQPSNNQNSSSEPEGSVYNNLDYYADVNNQAMYDYKTEEASASTQEYPLSTLDEICIYLGYLPEMRPVNNQDLIDNRLLRRGVWVIDTITRSGGASTGIVMTVQCRDRLKYLMDTFGSYNTAEGEDILVEDLKNLRTDSTTAPEDTRTSRVVNKRSDVILKIARRGIGQTNKFSIGGRRINTGWIYDPIVQGRADATGYEEAGIDMKKPNDNTIELEVKENGQTIVYRRVKQNDGTYKYEKSQDSASGTGPQAVFIDTGPEPFETIYEEAQTRKKNENNSSATGIPADSAPTPTPTTQPSPETTPTPTTQPLPETTPTPTTQPSSNSGSVSYNLWKGWDLTSDKDIIKSPENNARLSSDYNILYLSGIQSGAYYYAVYDPFGTRQGAVFLDGGQFVGQKLYDLLSQEKLADVWDSLQEKYNKAVPVNFD